MRNKRSLAMLLIWILLFFPSACVWDSGGGAAPASDPNAPLTVHFIDVGQADCTLLLCDGMAMLIDGGNVADSSLVVSYLKRQQLSHLDYLVCTHSHEDHVGGLSGVLNACTVGTVFSPVEQYESKAFQDFMKYVAQQGKSLVTPAPDESFYLGNALVEVLAPRRADYSAVNNSSIVLKVTHGDVSFLFTGDAERESEADMIDSGCDLSATVLKVGHHGSDSSTSYPFLREIMPLYAVIPVGADNPYNHPSDAVLSRLRDAGVTVYRSDMQGHIIATSKQSGVTFETEKQAKQTNPTETDGSGQNALQSAPAYYIGNLRSGKLHTPDCPSLPAAQNQLRFEDKEEALSSGYTPCSTCMGAEAE